LAEHRVGFGIDGWMDGGGTWFKGLLSTVQKCPNYIFSKYMKKYINYFFKGDND
jgi:hypothetical protein